MTYQPIRKDPKTGEMVAVHTELRHDTEGTLHVIEIPTHNRTTVPMRIRPTPKSWWAKFKADLKAKLKKMRRLNR